MKSFSAFLFLAFLTASFNASAISYEVIGPCSLKPLFSGTKDVTALDQSVGKTSKTIFDQAQIPYIGDEAGFNSINNTPIGLESIEVISDSTMRAYGWCYTVNGFGPDVLAGDFFFKSNEDKLVWFYAYSTYDSGQWIDYCVPSYKIKAAQFCEK